MENNKDLQCIYMYIVDNVDDEDIKELIIYLQDYVYNGSMVDFKENSKNDVCVCSISDLKELIKGLESEVK